VIVDLFQGQLKSSVRCLVCGFDSYQFEPFMYLALPLVAGASTDVRACLRAFLAEERLEGENRWHCPRCAQLRPASRKIDLWKTPTVLMIMLKRYRYSNALRNKLKSALSFPVELFTLEEFLPQARTHAERALYNLFAVVVSSPFPLTAEPHRRAALRPLPNVLAQQAELPLVQVQRLRHDQDQLAGQGGR